MSLADNVKVLREAIEELDRARAKFTADPFALLSGPSQSGAADSPSSRVREHGNRSTRTDAGREGSERSPRLRLLR